ncbi:hypothetical protein [Arsenicibacter rosenii]|nr:hypothetical protein [Arsenicibacter rosenii]
MSQAQETPKTYFLDSLSQYEESYRLFLVKKWQAERQEYIITTRKKWWYYLPSLGWALRGPSISANTGILAEIDYNRTVTSTRLESLDARYQVDFQETIGRIRSEYQKILIKQQQLERERVALAKLRAIQAIHNEAFKSQTMSPEEHLQHSYQYETTINNFKSKEAELFISILEFQNLCRYHLPDKELVPLEQSDCVTETGRKGPQGWETVGYPKR